MEHHQHQQQPNTSESFPTEITLEILLKLPVDSLLRCKSVCKSWCSLISDPQFIKSHLAISTRNNYYRLVFNAGQGEKLKSFNLHHVLYDNNSSINNALELDYPFRHPLKTPKIVGSCNGLVCVSIQGVAPYIWNPSTKLLNRLPPTGTSRNGIGWYVLYGFGYDESIDDYKVVELSCHDKGRTKCGTYVKIYSLKNGSGSWKEIGAFPHGFRFHMDEGKFCNGALHWAASKSPSYPWTIVSLDLAKETYGEVLQPVYDEGHYTYLTLGTLREWMCVSCEYRGIRTDFWVMKVYGMKYSWTKLVSIPYFSDPWTVQRLMPLCISNNGKLLLRFGLVGWFQLIVYDFKKGSFSKIQNFDNCQQASTFVESLVSPMPPQAPAGLGDR